MEIDEKLFHFAWKTKKRFSKVKLSNNACELKQVKQKLATIACAFFGKTVYTKEAESSGGIIGNSIFLPKNIDVFDDYSKNYNVYLYRILFDSTAILSGFHFKHNILAPYDFRIISLLCAPTIIKKSLLKYPNLFDFIAEYKSLQYDSLRDSFSKTGQAYFFNIWQMAIIDDKAIEASKLSTEKKSLIERLISHTELTPNEAIKLGKSYVSEFQELKIDKKCDYKLLPFFSKLPTTAQQLTIKKSSDSTIKESESEEEKTLKYSKSKERIKNIELDEKEPDCNPASLLMEGVQTADIFSGGRKMVDGSDEMDDHFEALEDLDMREVTRSSTQTQSIFKAEISVDIAYDDDSEDGSIRGKIPYDEWDFKKKSYKRNWCSLNEIKLKKPEDPTLFNMHYKNILKDNRKEIQRLRRNIEQILIQRRPKNRQADGPEIDIDALINCKADIVSGHSPNPNLYISKRKAPSDISVLLLIDSSLSADSWVKGRRVIDIAKDSIIVIEEVLQGIFDNIMIASFFSNTRKNNTFSIVKDFDESWEENASKLDGVKPTGYTRIGVALRHSFHHLDKVKSKNKVVLLLSDGKPTDYDAYEGKHGISDVRQCVREGKARGIDIFSLAIDKDAKFYFPQLFGKQNYEVLSSQSTLPEQLIKLFSKII